jgi:hypothetical protein
MPGTRHRRAGSEPYYEDVDPRFAVESPTDDGYSSHTSGLPSALTPGGMPPGAVSQGIPGGYPATPGADASQQPPPPPDGLASLPSQQHYGQYRTQAPPPNPGYLHPTYAGAGANDVLRSEPNMIDPNNLPPSNPESANSQENLPDGARSPGGSERASEASHFTSISERPVNPNWRPPSASGGSVGRGPGPSAAASAQRRREDVILGGNPDFSIPGMGPARGAGRQGRLPGAVAASGTAGMTPGGRYPMDI